MKENKPHIGMSYVRQWSAPRKKKLKRLRKKRQNILDGAEILEEMSFGEPSKKGCLGYRFSRHRKKITQGP